MKVSDLTKKKDRAQLHITHVIDEVELWNVEAK